MNLILLIFLMFLSFFFSGSEAALTSLADYKLKKIYFKHKLFREPLTLWVTKPYRILITILIWNTIVNLMISSTAAKFFISYFSFISKEVKELLIWFFISFMVIVFCELIPKIISKNFPEKISSIVLMPVWILQYVTFVVFSPILYFFEKSLTKNNKLHFTKIEEIKRLLSDSARYIFEKEDIAELFEKITKFNEVRIKDICIPKNKVIAINILNKSLQEIIDEIIESGKTRIPVYNGDINKVIGYILFKDIFYLCSSTNECIISELIRPILNVNYNEKAAKLLKKMQDEQIHVAVVFDDNNRFYGLVTLEDILEEIVGDILDEYDTKISLVK